MAQLPGEDPPLILYADVRYLLRSPLAIPPHQRFGKASYVYLFKNAAQNRGRLEIANNVGTPEQFAFSGFLDSVHIQYSHRHTCLLTITVNEVSQPAAAPGQPPSPTQWHIPSPDPRGEGKYMYKLHTLDVYFWTREDALSFLDCARGILPQTQLNILDAPVAPPIHNEMMSPVVQKLEQAVISEPKYRDSPNPTSSIKSTAPSFPPPPPNEAPEKQPETGSTSGEKPAASFAPLAYNPAAPAAPETIKHREKTPPPLEGAEGTGLAFAAQEDHGRVCAPTVGGQFLPQSPFSPPATQTSFFPGPPPRQQSFPANANPNAHFLPQSPPPPPPGAPPQMQSPEQGYPAQYAAYPAQQQQQQQYLGYGGMQSPVVQSPGPAQLGGYSQFDYSQPAAPQRANTEEYGVHATVYRPTQVEANSHYKPAPLITPEAGQPAGMTSARVEKLEKKMGGFLKMLEKKIG